MCDGSRNKAGLVFCTDSYTVSDVVKLINVLLIKWSIQSTLNYSGGKPRIQVNNKELLKIRALVKPHMFTHFMYKVRENYMFSNLQWTFLRS